MRGEKKQNQGLFFLGFAFKIAAKSGTEQSRANTDSADGSWDEHTGIGGCCKGSRNLLCWACGTEIHTHAWPGAARFGNCPLQAAGLVRLYFGNDLRIGLVDHYHSATVSSCEQYTNNSAARILKVQKG